MLDFFDLTLNDLETTIGALGKEKYRSRQLFKWVYNKGIHNFSEMTNITKDLRLIFGNMFDTGLPGVKDVLFSKDGSIKFAFLLKDGNIVESIFMPEQKRDTLCISTQIGCRMGCKFCVTGKIGYVRNLTTSEIVGQLMAVKQYLESKSNPPDINKKASFPDYGQDRLSVKRGPREPTEKLITNIVFMGMGEPVDNLDNVMHALDILKDPFGLDYSHRKITLSSVGLIDGLHLIKPKVAGIAISLNAADDEKRSYLMPINRIYPIRTIINFTKDFKGTNRTRITFEYILIKDFNDSLEDAKQLSEILKGVRCKINLIPYNESPYIEFKTPDPEKIEQFQAYLLSRNFTAIIRNSRGQDIGGACGQLGMRYLQDNAEGNKVKN